jgi:hypothetical protein
MACDREAVSAVAFRKVWDGARGGGSEVSSYTILAASPAHDLNASRALLIGLDHSRFC